MMRFETSLRDSYPASIGGAIDLFYSTIIKDNP